MQLQASERPVEIVARNDREVPEGRTTPNETFQSEEVESPQVRCIAGEQLSKLLPFSLNPSLSRLSLRVGVDMQLLDSPEVPLNIADKRLREELVELLPPPAVIDDDIVVEPLAADGQPRFAGSRTCCNSTLVTRQFQEADDLAHHLERKYSVRGVGVLDCIDRLIMHGIDSDSVHCGSATKETEF